MVTFCSNAASKAPHRTGSDEGLRKTNADFRVEQLFRNGSQALAARFSSKGLYSKDVYLFYCSELKPKNERSRILNDVTHNRR